MTIIPRLEDPSEDAALRKAAQLQLEALVAFRDTLISEAASSTRWLHASLLAINGGAIVAIMDASIIPLYAKLISIGVFGGGVLCALLSSWLGQRLNRQPLQPIMTQIGYYALLSETGQRDSAIEQQYQDDLKLAMRGAWKSQAAGWLSAFCFLSGGVLSGLSAVS